MAIGVGRVRRCRFLCFHFRPLAFHCPVPCGSRRGREELGETRSSRASHGEKGVTITAADVLQPSSLVPVMLRNTMHGRRWTSNCGEAGELRAIEPSTRPGFGRRDAVAGLRRRIEAAGRFDEREKIKKGPGQCMRQSRLRFREKRGALGAKTSRCRIKQTGGEVESLGACQPGRRKSRVPLSR